MKNNMGFGIIKIIILIIITVIPIAVLKSSIKSILIPINPGEKTTIFSITMIIFNPNKELIFLIFKLQHSLIT